jgi:hypothetical protein
MTFAQLAEDLFIQHIRMRERSIAGVLRFFQESPAGFPVPQLMRLAASSSLR